MAQLGTIDRFTLPPSTALKNLWGIVLTESERVPEPERRSAATAADPVIMEFFRTRS